MTSAARARRSPLPQQGYRDWRPAGRALHLVDLENLVGPAERDLDRLAALAVELRRLGGVGAGDHVVVATNPGQILAAAGAFPGARLLVGRGPDGADRALLEGRSALEVVRCYDRLVVMSGDHIFVDLAGSVRRWGRPVRVVAHRGALSGRLARAASEVRELRLDRPVALAG